MDFHLFSKKYRKVIERQLRVITKANSVRAEREATEVSFMIKKILAELPSRGKKLRSLLFLYLINLYGGKIKSEHLTVACALELVHNYFLIHDDVIDNDNWRGGVPSVLGWLRNNYHAAPTHKIGDKGVAQAIVMGDIVSSIAFAVIAASRLKDAKKITVARLLNEAIKKTVSGQYFDSEGSLMPDATIASVKKHYYLKTTYYSFLTPLKLADLFVVISKKEYKIIEDAFLKIGEAYQIKNDLAGIDSKRNNTDIVCGRHTIVLQTAFLSLTRKDKIAFSRQYAANPRQYAKEVQRLIKQTQATEEAKKEITNCCNQAVALFGGSGGQASRVEDLKSFVNFTFTYEN